MKTSNTIVLGVLMIFLVGMSGVLITAFGQEDPEERVTQPKVLLKEITPDQAKAIALEAVPGEILEVGTDRENGVSFYEVSVQDGNLERGVTIDFSGRILSIEVEEEDVSITGTPLETASSVALNHVGEGRVTDSEVGDEEGYYEIEITLDNGGEVDVHLDENFNVLSTEYD